MRALRADMPRCQYYEDASIPDGQPCGKEAVAIWDFGPTDDLGQQYLCAKHDIAMQKALIPMTNLCRYYEDLPQ